MKRKPKSRPHSRIYFQDDIQHPLLFRIICDCGHTLGYMDRLNAYRNQSYVQKCCDFFARKLRAHKRLSAKARI